MYVFLKCQFIRPSVFFSFHPPTHSSFLTPPLPGNTPSFFPPPPFPPFLPCVPPLHNPTLFSLRESHHKTLTLFNPIHILPQSLSYSSIFFSLSLSLSLFTLILSFPQSLLLFSRPSYPPRLLRS